MRKSSSQALDIFCGIQAEQLVQPFFNGIIVTIPDWLVQLYLIQFPAHHCLSAVALMGGLHPILLLQGGEQLQRETSSCALVAVDGR